MEPLELFAAAIQTLAGDALADGADHGYGIIMEALAPLAQEELLSALSHLNLAKQSVNRAQLHNAAALGARSYVRRS